MITDLSASECGDSIVLSFTLPRETAQGGTLNRRPTIDIYRSFGRPLSASAAKTNPPELIVTVPSQMVDRYSEGEQVVFPDSLTAAELAAHLDAEAVYSVRTRISKRDSDSSNLARIRILPALHPVENLRAQIGQSAIQLSWTAPAIPAAGSLQPTYVRYRIYRSDATAENRGPSLSTLNPLMSPPESLMIGESFEPSYTDTKFEFFRAYAYTVRAAAIYESGSVESGNSKVLEVTPRDTFAPATPENVVATAGAGTRTNGPYVDLSWAINRDTDLAGYNVYRSDIESEQGPRMNTALLATPVFLDASVKPGKYFYRVTAVDRSGNESSPSAPVAVLVPMQNDGPSPL